VADDDYCYLTTVGRRSGRPHRIEIWYAEQGDALYFLAGAGAASDWVANLAAQPSVRVELGDETFDGTGSVIDDADEAELARTLVFAKYAPRYTGDLTDWRERALPVVIRRVHADRR
jgi:deazaflavin-dependent oxidoreductase (nitroreductase family)